MRYHRGTTIAYELLVVNHKMLALYVMVLLFYVSARTLYPSRKISPVVSIELQGVHVCTGTTVNREWLLTAASCFDKNYRLEGYKLKTTATVDSGTQTEPLRMLNVFKHPLYDPYEKKNNIALVKFELSHPYSNITVLEVPNENRELFAYAYSKWYPMVADCAVCTDDKICVCSAGSTTFIGDLGAPLARRNHSTGEFELVGIGTDELPNEFSIYVYTKSAVFEEGIESTIWYDAL